MAKLLSAIEALKAVKSFDRVFIHSAAATPQQLVRALAVRAPELEKVKIYSIHTEGDCSYAHPSLVNSFEIHSFFNGPNLRQIRPHVNECYVPIFLSEISNLFYSGAIPLDVALVQVSPPDKHGMCSLGPSVDVSIAAVRTAKTIIAQVNPKMPRTFGDAEIEYNKINAVVAVDEELFLASSRELGPVELQIGKYVASLIEDGATLQIGIGAIPAAVLKCLDRHKNLGIHTEMFSDGIVDLYKSGAITNKLKSFMTGKILSSFVLGSRKVYDFIDDNPLVVLVDAAISNDVDIIRQNPKVVAINSAIEVDLTGQVCADSIGSGIYSGVGGQIDFMRGAALSFGGKPIIALPSKTRSGLSKIKTILTQGSGITTTRAHVHYVVTEHGIAYLHGKTLGERARAMIQLAAPEFRDQLKLEARTILAL
jgi:4-hydroxybutyrate CoA-transferase